MENKVKLSVVVPVYNSEGTIGTLVEGLKKTLHPKMSYEIILVNDCSIDNSGSVCRMLANKDKSVKFINLSRNFGQSSAILTGFRHTSGEYVMCIDDDMQNPPEEILNFVIEVEKGYDIVFARYDSHKESPIRKILSKINDALAMILVDKPRGLYLSSMFIARRYVAREMSRYEGPFPNAVWLIFRITRNIGVVSATHKERVSGRSNYDFYKLLCLAINGYTNFSIKPLRMSTLLGFSISLMGSAYAIFLIIRKISTPTVPLGWTSLIAAILFIGGLNLMIIGMVGEYVGRTFLLLNRQPQSVIKETVNISSDDGE